MSIFEYDEEKHLQMEREQFWNEGHKEGTAEGIAQEKRQRLWEPIYKKLAKGKSISRIAEELECKEYEILEAIEEMKKEGLIKEK